jgi:hypothetical protein
LDKLGNSEVLAYFYNENDQSFYFFEINNAAKTVTFPNSIKIPESEIPPDFLQNLNQNSNLAIQTETSIRQIYQIK